MKEKKYLIVDKETGEVVKETNAGERRRGGALRSFLLGFVGGIVAVALAVAALVAYIGLPVKDLPQLVKDVLEEQAGPERIYTGKVWSSTDGSVIAREFDLVPRK